MFIRELWVTVKSHSIPVKKHDTTSVTDPKRCAGYFNWQFLEHPESDSDSEEKVFNLSLASHIFSQARKMDRVAPLLKPDKVASKGEPYRPISLL